MEDEPYGGRWPRWISLLLLVGASIGAWALIVMLADLIVALLTRS